MNLGNSHFRRYALLLVIVCLSGSTIFAQEKTANQRKYNDFCDNNNYSYGDNKASFNEVRETTLRPSDLLTVDGKRNGGIHVKGSNRADVLVRACVQAQGNSDEAARAVARNIRIETSPVIHAENSTDDSNWAVSYEILVPRTANLKLTTHNGGISIDSVEGTMEFTALNGGVHLSEVAGDVKGKTTNGGLHIELSGNSWKGAGLDVETTNGGVHLSLPETYAAHIETGTVNGGFRSEISTLNVERKDRERAVRLNTDFNGGGATVRVITTNGGVHINTPDKTR
ncbi:MAG: DUF4097 family beta strand repeat-containing protein [Pyrinomonadaceae bacterium]